MIPAVFGHLGLSINLCLIDLIESARSFGVVNVMCVQSNWLQCQDLLTSVHCSSHLTVLWNLLSLRRNTLFDVSSTPFHIT